MSDPRTASRLQLTAARWGDFLFRWRSYLPLSLVPFVIVAIVVSEPPRGSHRADVLWELGCLLLALGGLGIRVFTVGVAAPGTSGRNTREQKAASLNTTGSYSIVRHPLYLGNAIIVLGLASFPHTWLIPPVVAALTLGYYGCIALREEQYLRERFGSAFDDWAASVPALLPAFGRWVPPARRFDWRLVLRREFYGLSLILIAPLGLGLAEDVARQRPVDVDPLWGAAAVAGAVIFVGARFVKKRTCWLARTVSTASAVSRSGDSRR